MRQRPVGSIANERGVSSVGVGQDRVGVRLGGDHLMRAAHHAVVADRADGDPMAAVRRAEEKAPAAVGREVGHAVGQRRGTEQQQRAVARIDRIAQRFERIGAARCIEKAPVRADGQRQQRAAGNDALARRQFGAFGIQAEDMDLAVAGTGDVDDAHRIVIRTDLS